MKISFRNNYKFNIRVQYKKKNNTTNINWVTPTQGILQNIYDSEVRVVPCACRSA